MAAEPAALARRMAGLPPYEDPCARGAHAANPRQGCASPPARDQCIAAERRSAPPVLGRTTPTRLAPGRRRFKVSCVTSDSAHTWEAHRRYVSTGALAADLLREPVLRAWERCHLQGASPRRLRAVQLEPPETERLLAHRQPLLQAARPYVQALARAAGAERHAAMLGDPRGVVLDVLGDPASTLGPDRVPGPGSLLSEAVSGANGIGTPLAERGYVELVGPEHFIEGFHPFTCQGIPILGPDGAVTGVISVSVRRVEAGRRLRELLVCAAHGVEAELIRQRLDDDVRQLVAAGGRDDEPLLERLRQDLVQVQATARLGVASAARDLARDRLEVAARLLSLARASIAEFARQSALWRDLAATAAAPPRLVDVAELVRDLATLLRTEAATARLTLAVDIAEPLHVEVDPPALSRRLLRAALQAFDVARGGGTARVSLRRRGDGLCEVLLCATPPPAPDAGQPLSLSLPVGPARERPAW